VKEKTPDICYADNLEKRLQQSQFIYETDQFNKRHDAHSSNCISHHNLDVQSKFCIIIEVEMQNLQEFEVKILFAMMTN
jgi:hypothetical protein